MLVKLMDNDIHIDDPVQFDWEPGCAEDKLLASMLKDADIPYYFSFQVRNDHEAEPLNLFRLQLPVISGNKNSERFAESNLNHQ